MRTTGLSFAAVLTAAGAILAWAVTYDADGVDLNMVGTILFVIGLVLAGIFLIAGAVGTRKTIDTERETMVNGQHAVEHRRDTVNYG